MYVCMYVCMYVFMYVCVYVSHWELWGGKILEKTEKTCFFHEGLRSQQDLLSHDQSSQLVYDVIWMAQFCATAPMKE